MTYTLTVTVELRCLALAAAILALFGILYNTWVAGLEHRGHDRGFMALIVSLGCAITSLGFAAVTNLWLGLILLICFAASGIPMIVGSIARYIHARDVEERARVQRSLDRLGGE